MTVLNSSVLTLPRQKRDLRDVVALVEALDLSPIAWLAVHGSSPMVGAAEGLIAQHRLPELVRDYMRFIALALMYPDHVVVPGKWVDDFWHLHILDTMGYEVDTRIQLGVAIHHYPYETDLIDQLHSYMVTDQLLKLHFGQGFTVFDPALSFEFAMCGDGPQCIGSGPKCGGVAINRAVVDSIDGMPSGNVPEMPWRRKLDFDRLPLICA